MPRVGKYWLALDLYHAPFKTAHTWAKVEPKNMVRVGVDDFAQKQAEDLLFIRLFPAESVRFKVSTAFSKKAIGISEIIGG